MINRVIKLSRINKQLVMLFVDSVLLVGILLASFSIRLGYWYFPDSDLIWVILGSPVIAALIFVKFGLYRAVVRYIGFKALWSVVQAVSIYALVWGAVGFIAAVDGIPRSVILINWVLSLLAIGGLRVVARWLFTRDSVLENSTKSSVNCKKVLIYGAEEKRVRNLLFTKFIKNIV